MSERFVGIDVGAETIKIVELIFLRDQLEWRRRAIVEHHKEPVRMLKAVLADWDWDNVSKAAITGRMPRKLPRMGR